MSPQMQGLTIASLKKHPALIPLFVIIAGGLTMAGTFLARLALFSPDVKYRNKSDGHLSNEFLPDNYRYRFYSPIIDYSKLESPRPRYWEMDDEKK